MKLTEYRKAVWDMSASDGPFLTISLDLTLSPDGHSVAAPVFRKALAAAIIDAEKDARSLADAAGPTVEAAIEEATSAGARGLHLVVSPGGISQHASPLAFRNHVRLGQAPWIFELERQNYLLRRPVLVVEVTRREVRVARVEAAEVSEDRNFERDEHATHKAHGRANAEGRSGAPGGMGGHSRNSIEGAVAEKRALAAREAVAEVMALFRPGDLVLLAGTPEPKAEFLSHLSGYVVNAITESTLTAIPSDQHELLALAGDLAATSQLAMGEAAAVRVIGGAAGEQIARGCGAVWSALEGGRISELVMHEDVVAHWGNALDARRQLPGWDDASYEVMLRATLNSSGAVVFSRHPDLLARYEGVVATTRW